MTGGRSRNRHWCILTIGVVLTLGVAACGSTAKVGAPQQATTATTVAKTKKPPSVNGLHTVLSPIGVNIRANPAKTAAVVASAAQGVGVHVVGHSAQDGGWLEVKGASVTGWMTADPALSAPGMFTVFAADSGAFGVLYPSAWTANEESPAVTVFAPKASPESVTISAGATVDQLGIGSPGYRQTGSEQVVACGVTTYVVTYTRDAPVGATTTAAPTTTTTTTLPPGATTVPGATTTVAPTQFMGTEMYLIEVRLTVDAQHALGIDANLTSLSQRPDVMNFVNSITFSAPACQP